MTRIVERRKAIKMRKQGKTYVEIKNQLGISKSTLSDWLGRFPLNDNQMLRLAINKKQKKNLAIEKTILTKRAKREKRIEEIYEREKEYWFSLTNRELNLAGLFLYWGEGNKRLNGPVSLNNTDPEVLKFTFVWLKSGLNISRKKIKVDLHLYNDMNIKKEMEFWSRELNIPLAQFRKPYIKISKKSEISHKGFGHGTCGLIVNDVRLKEKVMMGIKAISQCYN